jgi:hypothetical protein
MSTMREHMAKVHTVAAAFHRTMAECHGDALGKAVAGDPMRHFHETAQGAHAAAAEAHTAMCEECQKGTDAIDLSKRDPDALVPTTVSAIAPPAGVTAVPRAGAPPMPTASVAPEFKKMFATEDEEESSLIRR